MNQPEPTRTSIIKSLKDRHDLGKVIIHDLVEPAYNLTALAREVAISVTESTNDKESIDQMLALCERIQTKVINLHDISFNNDKLMFITVINLQALIEQVVRNSDSRFTQQCEQLQLPKASIQIVGDKEIIRFWIESAISLLLSAYRHEPKYSITINETIRDFLQIQLIIRNSEHNIELLDSSLNRALDINFVTRLLGANIRIVEEKNSLALCLELTRDGAPIQDA